MTWHFSVLCCRVDFHEAPIEPARACTDLLMARPLLHSGPSDFGKLGSIASLERPEQCTPRSTMDRPAENGQDEWLNNCIFRGKTRGTFLELGAFDGQFGSNSLMVENPAVTMHHAAIKESVFFMFSRAKISFSRILCSRLVPSPLSIRVGNLYTQYRMQLPRLPCVH